MLPLKSLTGCLWLCVVVLLAINKLKYMYVRASVGQWSIRHTEMRGLDGVYLAVSVVSATVNTMCL